MIILKMNILNNIPNLEELFKNALKVYSESKTRIDMKAAEETLGEYTKDCRNIL